jgi:malonate-semialdehyde dehydrogenase (acetylating)/methylmalonate-semialdehyde dehydrogenase
VLLPVGEAHKESRERLIEAARSLKVGDGLDPATDMGPVISGRHRERVMSYVNLGVSEGATLALDGRDRKVPDQGFFVGPSVFDAVQPSMRIGREEIFGPVATICPVKNLDEAFAIMDGHPNANATSIFTTSGKAARDFAHRATSSMVGVNIGVAAPMAYFPFGGARDSFFGDLKVHGRDAFAFYTDQKVTIARW